MGAFGREASENRMRLELAALDRLYFCAKQGRFRKGRLRPLLTQEPGGLCLPVFSDTGKALAYLEWLRPRGEAAVIEANRDGTSGVVLERNDFGLVALDPSPGDLYPTTLPRDVLEEWARG